MAEPTVDTLRDIATAFNRHDLDAIMPAIIARFNLTPPARS